MKTLKSFLKIWAWYWVACGVGIIAVTAFGGFSATTLP